MPLFESPTDPEHTVRYVKYVCYVYMSNFPAIKSYFTKSRWDQGRLLTKSRVIFFTASWQTLLSRSVSFQTFFLYPPMLIFHCSKNSVINSITHYRSPYDLCILLNSDIPPQWSILLCIIIYPNIKINVYLSWFHWPFVQICLLN